MKALKNLNDYVGALVLVAIVLAAFTMFSGDSQMLGNKTASFWNAVGGFQVNGTEVISSSRAASFTTGTFSSTLDVTGASALSGLLTLNAGSNNSYSLATTTSATTYTLTAADIGNYDTIRQILTGGTATFTFPATSTLTSLVPAAGDMAKTCWMPLTNNLVFAAGAGIDLMVATSTVSSGAFDLTITAGGVGCIEWFRQTDTDVTAGLIEYENAD